MKQIELEKFNPYVFGPPVNDPNLFFGREYELQEITSTISHLLPGARQSIAIVGPRRIGKSSILIQLANRLKNLPSVFTLVSTESFVEPLPKLLTKEILLGLRESIQAKETEGLAVNFELLENPSISPEEIFQVFRRDLKLLNERLMGLKKQAPAVIMIDEVEGLVRFGGQGVLGLFRDLAQTLPSILFIVAGSDKLYQLINDYTSPFFNVFKTVSIKPLQKEDAMAMVVEPSQQAQLNFKSSAVDEVLRSAGGEPYLINMICHYATERALNSNSLEISSKNVREAQRHIVKHEEYLQPLLRQLQESEKVILYALAKINQPCLVEGLIAFIAELTGLNFQFSKVPELLSELVQSQILRQDKRSRYLFRNQLLPAWFLSRESVIEEIEKSISKPVFPDLAKNSDEKRETLKQRLDSDQRDIAFLEKLSRSTQKDEDNQQIIESIDKIKKRLLKRVDIVQPELESLSGSSTSSSDDNQPESRLFSSSKNFNRIKFMEAFSYIVEAVPEAAKNIKDGLDKSHSKNLKKVSIEFGLILSDKYNMYIANNAAESAATIRMSWKKNKKH